MVLGATEFDMFFGNPNPYFAKTDWLNWFAILNTTIQLEILNRLITLKVWWSKIQVLTETNPPPDGALGPGRPRFMDVGLHIAHGFPDRARLSGGTGQEMMMYGESIITYFVWQNQPHVLARDQSCFQAQPQNGVTLVTNYQPCIVWVCVCVRALPLDNECKYSTPCPQVCNRGSTGKQLPCTHHW